MSFLSVFVSLVNTCLLSVSFAGVILTCTKPLFKVADLYLVHLFPQKDDLEYTPNYLQTTSQHLYIATSVFLGISILFSLVETIQELAERPENRIYRIKVIGALNVAISFALYTASFITLAQVIQGVKDTLDHIPVLPNVDVSVELGGTMNIIGLTSMVLVMISTTSQFVYKSRQSSIAL